MPEPEPSVCPFCSLHCADLRLSFDGGRRAGAAPRCPWAEAALQQELADLAGTASSPPALGAARGWLGSARQPLVVLSGRIENEAVSAAVRLAEGTSAILASAEESGASLAEAVRTAGLRSATLAELRQVEQVVVAGLSPAELPPRLGAVLGRDLAGQALLLPAAGLLETVRSLRLSLQDPACSGTAARLAGARSGLVLFGPGPDGADAPGMTELLLLLAELGRDRPWYGLCLAPDGNTRGVSETLLAETGRPGAMRFGPGGIEHSSWLYRAGRLLALREVDLVIWVGRPSPSLEDLARRGRRIRMILLDPHPPGGVRAAWLPCARAGLDAPGRVIRLDGVPLELPRLLASPRRPLAELLAWLGPEGRA